MRVTGRSPAATILTAFSVRSVIVPSQPIVSAAQRTPDSHAAGLVNAEIGAGEPAADTTCGSLEVAGRGASAPMVGGATVGSD